MHRNQLNNGLQRTCAAVYKEAYDSLAAGQGLNVKTGWHHQDDTYVDIQWRREDNTPEELFPYTLLSDVVYTVWSWVVNTNSYDTLWVEVWDFRDSATKPILLGQLGAFKDRLFLNDDQNTRDPALNLVSPVETA